MNFYRRIRGPYVTYRPIGRFSAEIIVQLKKVLTDDLKDTSQDFAIDLRKIQELDVTGLRFFKNLGDLLQKTERKLAFFGGDKEVQKSLAEYSDYFDVYPTLQSFEKGFHEMSSETMRYYFELAIGKSAFKTMDLICPSCKCENVKGFVIDENRYTYEWLENQITPKWTRLDDENNEVDYDLYSVAVCPECYFASHRLDWFSIKLPEGTIHTKLTPHQIENLSNQVAKRKEFLMKYHDLDDPKYFGLPREHSAGLVSWRLNELTLRTVAKDRNNIDGFDIAMSNFMVCKYSESEKEITDSISTAEAWLNGVLENKQAYSSDRVVQAYVYFISIQIMHEKINLSKKLLEELNSQYGYDDDYNFWISRITEMLED